MTDKKVNANKNKTFFIKQLKQCITIQKNYDTICDVLKLAPEAPLRVEFGNAIGVALKSLSALAGETLQDTWVEYYYYEGAVERYLGKPQTTTAYLNDVPYLLDSPKALWEFIQLYNNSIKKDKNI